MDSGSREYAREALELALESRDSQGVLFVLQHIAAIAILSCDEGHATSTALGVARILGYIDASIERVGSIREYNEQQEGDRVRRRLAAELSVEELASRLAEGALMTSQQHAT